MSDQTSGNAVCTKSKKSTTTNKKRARKFKYQFRNNICYQYKIQYHYKQDYYMTLPLRPLTSESKKDPDTAEISRVQPTSTSRLTSGLALRSTLRLTLYNTINVNLTLRPLSSETNMESHKDPDTAEIKRVQPTSTLRLTSGLALRSTLRLTLYNVIYVTLTLRPLTSEINMESHKDPDIAEKTGYNQTRPRG
jgi:hypothetical protein